jgi:hypothetical protein
MAKRPLNENITLAELFEAEARGEQLPEIEAARTRFAPFWRKFAALKASLKVPEAGGPPIGVDAMRNLALARAETPAADTPDKPPADRQMHRSRAEWQKYFREVRDRRAALGTEGALRFVARKHSLHFPSLRARFYSQKRPRR